MISNLFLDINLTKLRSMVWYFEGYYIDFNYTLTFNSKFKISTTQGCDNVVLSLAICNIMQIKINLNSK